MRAAECPHRFVLLAEGGVRVVWACGDELVNATETAVDIAVLADRPWTQAHHHHRHWPG